MHQGSALSPLLFVIVMGVAKLQAYRFVYVVVWTIFTLAPSSGVQFDYTPLTSVIKSYQTSQHSKPPFAC